MRIAVIRLCMLLIVAVASAPARGPAEELAGVPDYSLPVGMTAAHEVSSALDFDSFDDATSCCSDAGHCRSCFGCSSCSSDVRWWARGDYLLWWTKDNFVPPLVTTSPPTTPFPQAGVIGAPGTQILSGNSGIDDRERHGGRISFGLWCDGCHEVGWQASLFSVGDGPSRDNFSAQSAGDPILARPFFNTVRNAQDSSVVAFPNELAGSVEVTTSSEMHSAALSLRRTWSHGCIGRFDLLAGYRFFRYREGLMIEDTVFPVAFAGNVVIDRFDRFRTENDFHGGEIGLSAEFDRGPWTLDVLAKLAIGNVHKQVAVDGRTNITVFGATAEFDRGLLAQPSNIGTRSSNDIGILPELNLNLRYNATPCLSFLFGYTFLYLNESYRTGDQIDFNVDPRQLPPFTFVGTDPAPLMRTTHFWAQGINFGVEVRR